MTGELDSPEPDQTSEPESTEQAPELEEQDREEMREEGREEEHREGGREGRDRRERRPRIDSFEKMKVWQEAHALTMRVFGNTPKLPAEQQGGLAMQMEQAAVNVPRTIAEGFKRRGPRNKAHFYNVAQTALEGLRYYLILCRDLGYEIDYQDLSYRTDQVGRMLDGLVRSMMR